MDWEERLSHMEELVVWAGRLSAAAGAPDARHWQGVRSLQTRLRSRSRPGQAPVLVAALVGPTGVGKSTVFHALTGVDVPRGGHRRPLSFAPCAALPPSGSAEDSLPEALFPTFACRPLQRPEELENPSLPDSVLFHTPQHLSGLPREQPFCLVDVPDFDSVHRLNEEKALRLVERSEVVLFIVSAEKYSDAKSFHFLRLCCREAGRLIVLLTRHDGISDARSHWDHLHEQARSHPDFADLRADGKPLHRFLAEAAAYCSLRISPGESLPADAMMPLAAEAPPLAELLGGAEGRTILVEALENAARVAAGEVRALHRQAESMAEENAADIQRARSIIARAVTPLAEATPTIAELHAHREEASRQLKIRGRSLLPSRLREMLIRPAQPTHDGLRGEAPPPSLRDVCGTIQEDWRAAFPHLAGRGAPLSSESFTAALDEVLLLPPPKPESDWRDELRDALEEWRRKNFTSRGGWAGMKQWSTLGGITVFGLDAFLTGLTSGVGIATLLGSGALVALSEAQEASLRASVRAAIDRWRARHAIQWTGHLETHLARPLFLDEWIRRETRWEEIDSARVETLCRAFSTDTGGSE